MIPSAVTERAQPPPARPKPVSAVDPRVVRALMAAAEESAQAVLAVAISLAAATGCPRGELCGLRWPDLDPVGVLHVRHSLKHGLDGHAVELRDTKTHQERKIALDEFALAVLRAHRSRAETWASQAGIEVRADGFILSFDPTGACLMKPDTVTPAVREAHQDAGYPAAQPRPSPLQSHPAPRGQHRPRTVAGRLRHADPSITMRVYAGFLQERDREAAQVMGRLLTGPLAAQNSPEP